LSMDQPLFVFGPPRSGTTFFQEALQQHSRIFITNELRALDFVNSVFREKAQDHHLIHNAQYRDEFITMLEASMRSLFEYFYLPKLRAKTALPGVWGDKTPGYGDPLLSPGCLETINKLFPTAKFILLSRSPLWTVNSIVAKKWETVVGAIGLWGRIISNGRRFGAEIGPDRFMEIRYEEMRSNPKPVFNAVLRFLRLERCEKLDAFLKQEETSPRPIADPISGTPWNSEEGRPLALSHAELEVVKGILGDNLIDIDGSLSRYQGWVERTARERAGFSAKILDSKSTSISNIELPIAVQDGQLSGEQDVAIKRVGVLLPDGTLSTAAVPRFIPQSKVAFEVQVSARRPIEELVVGYLVFDTDRQALHSVSNCSAGQPTLRLPQGESRIRVEVTWPTLKEGHHDITLTLGEGNHHINHIRQCWAHNVIPFQQGA